MIDQLLVERIWSLSGADPAYLAEIRRICLPGEANVPSTPGPLALLPHLFCELHGGSPSQVVPVITAWTIFRYAARILDNLEDNASEPIGRSGACLLNASTGLIFTAGMALNYLEEFGVSHPAAIEVRHRFYGDLLKTCGGQYLDLAMSAPSVEEWWNVAGAKTGAFLGLICWAGGRVADAPHSQLELYRQFGYNLGLLDQIRDDLTDLWSDHAQPGDLHNLHNRGLPLTYALAVLPSGERQQLLTLVQQASDSFEAEQMAQELIIKSGAAVYLNVQSICLYQQSMALITQMGLPMEIGQKLAAMLDKARLPVKT